MTLTTEDHEWLFDALAQALDQVGPERGSLLLAKLSMLLADAIGDRAAIELALATALEHIPKARP